MIRLQKVHLKWVFKTLLSFYLLDSLDLLNSDHACFQGMDRVERRRFPGFLVVALYLKDMILADQLQWSMYLVEVARAYYLLNFSELKSLYKQQS